MLIAIAYWRRTAFASGARHKGCYHMPHAHYSQKMRLFSRFFTVDLLMIDFCFGSIVNCVLTGGASLLNIVG